MWRNTKFQLAALCTTFAVLAVQQAFSDYRYTPRHIWKNDWETEFHEQWYGRVLRAMKEPSLWQLSKTDKNVRVYRILQLPSFSVAVAARLVVQTDGSGKMHVVELGGTEWHPGNPKDRRLIELEPKQIQAFEVLLEHTGFWDKRIGMSERTDRPRTSYCTDGITYVVEAVSFRDYKLVTRHICWMENEILEILTALAKLSELPPPIRLEP